MYVYIYTCIYIYAYTYTYVHMSYNTYAIRTSIRTLSISLSPIIFRKNIICTWGSFNKSLLFKCLFAGLWRIFVPKNLAQTPYTSPYSD